MLYAFVICDVILSNVDAAITVSKLLLAHIVTGIVKYCFQVDASTIISQNTDDPKYIICML